MTGVTALLLLYVSLLVQSDSLGGGAAAAQDDRVDIGGILRCSQNDSRVCGPIPLNCSGGGDVQTVLTDLATMTRYTGPWAASSLPESDAYTAVPLIVPPGVQSSCLSRSPGVPASCRDGCVTTMDIFSKEWDVSGQVICTGTYPNLNSTNAQTHGYVTISVLNQCRDVEYGPPWVATVRDEWGSLWALHSAATPMQEYDDWLRNLKSVYWPKGWIYEEIIPRMNETITAYLAGDDCITIELKDSNRNTWQMYDYPVTTDNVLSSLQCFATQTDSKDVDVSMSDETSTVENIAFPLMQQHLVVFIAYLLQYKFTVV